MVEDYYQAKGKKAQLVIFEDTEDEIVFTDVQELKTHIRKVNNLSLYLDQNRPGY